MQIPTIHINGTSRERLLEGLVAANDALLKAQQAVAETAPNARDYYPQGPDAIRAAEREHYSRLTRIINVRQELEEIAEAICDAEVRR
jgi:hypothetical protein